MLNISWITANNLFFPSPQSVLLVSSAFIFSCHPTFFVLLIYKKLFKAFAPWEPLAKSFLDGFRFYCPDHTIANVSSLEL